MLMIEECGGALVLPLLNQESTHTLINLLININASCM
jgi:hypothetical protein